MSEPKTITLSDETVRLIEEAEAAGDAAHEAERRLIYDRDESARTEWEWLFADRIRAIGLVEDALCREAGLR